MSACEQLRQLMLRLGAEIDSHDLEQLRVPDSRAVGAADALAAEGQSTTLTNHGLRSYGFGALLGIREERAFDAEVFYVASLLHDIGLMPAFDRGGRFEDDGEAVARELLAEVGWEPGRAERAGKAVRDHWDGPENESDVESLLLAYGTSVDVSGRRLDEFTSTTIGAVCDSAPRCGFKEQFVGLVEGKLARGGDPHLERMAMSGLAERVRSTPFAE
ncbi:MAG: HD domain-containing protein [Actinobacteria bacterium]|nr:HD domain-containing protein [Actinomycetota bacterium]